MKHRYLGSAAFFASEARKWIQRPNGQVPERTTAVQLPGLKPLSSRRREDLRMEPTYYHAKAAASLLLFQMAVEFSPAHSGYGMPFDEIAPRSLQTAMQGMNASAGVETFWGPINIGHDASRGFGWNSAYEIGIGQFQKNLTHPTLVNFKGKSLAAPAQPNDPLVSYPAAWPDWCLVEGPFASGAPGVLSDACLWYYLEHAVSVHLGLSLGIFVSILLTVVLVCCGCCSLCRRKRGRADTEGIPAQLRESLLGSTELPNVTLANQDVAGRWRDVRVQPKADKTLEVMSPVEAGSVRARLHHGVRHGHHRNTRS